MLSNPCYISVKKGTFWKWSIEIPSCEIFNFLFFFPKSPLHVRFSFFFQRFFPKIPPYRKVGAVSDIKKMSLFSISNPFLLFPSRCDYSHPYWYFFFNFALRIPKKKLGDIERLSKIISMRFENKELESEEDWGALLSKNHEVCQHNKEKLTCG